MDKTGLPSQSIATKQKAYLPVMQSASPNKQLAIALAV
jgi:hypothetical protein